MRSVRATRVWRRCRSDRSIPAIGPQRSLPAAAAAAHLPFTRVALRGGLLATTSLVALALGTVTQARAACYSGPYPHINAGTISCVTVTNTAFSGNVSNTGTVSPGGISLTNSTITGQISSTGTIAGGITLDSASKITNVTNGIAISGTTFGGGITNSGTILASGVSNAGIRVNTLSTFTGGISNSGTVSGAASAVRISFVSTFAGGITNSGTVTGTNAQGIYVTNVSNFSGGISSSSGGKISAPSNGIVVQFVSTFSGGISNKGTITSPAVGIDVGAFVTSFAGGINNSGTITGAGVFGINVTVSTFVGGITNSGAITGALGIRTLPSETFAGGISNGGPITASAYDGIQTSNSFFSGGISNSSTITANRVGIWASEGSTFSGGISNGGTITSASKGIVAAISTFSGGITNSGTITSVSHGILVSGATFTGNISGTISGNVGIAILSGLTFAGGSAIVNSGTITGTGGTAIDVSGATSPVTIDHQAGLLSGAVNLSAFADQLNISGGTVNGNIVGQGSSNTVNFALGGGTFTYGSAFGFSGINQVNVNSGTVILDGTNSANTIAVNAGNLQVGDDANSLASLTGAVSVNGGTLSGHGTIIGGVFINPGGMLAPGGSIGILTISGNLVFTAASHYLITINGVSNSATSVTGAPGTAALGSASVGVAPGSVVVAGHTYTILTATGGVTGSFNPTVTYGALTGTLTYDANDVFLTLGAGAPSKLTSLLPPGAPTNVVNVAGAVDNFTGGGGTLSGGFQGLFNLAPPQLEKALTQLSGEAATGAMRGGFQMTNAFLSLLLDPFTDGRSEIFSRPTSCAADRRQSAKGTRVRAAARRAPPVVACSKGWNVWAAGFGGTSSTSGDPAGVGSHDAMTRTGAFAAGLDYVVSPHTIVGLALAGGGLNWGLAGGLGGHGDVFLAGLYGSHQFGTAYVAGAVSFGAHWMSTDRTVTVAGIDQLSASFNAQNIGARLEGGYHIPASLAFGATPYAALQAQSFLAPAYSETAVSGSPEFALAFNAQTATAVRAELGSRFERTFARGDGTALGLFARLAWAHDWQSNPALGATFLGLPTASFVVNGAAPPSDLLLITVGAEWHLHDGWSLLAKLDGELADRAQTFTGIGQARYAW